MSNYSAKIVSVTSEIKAKANDGQVQLCQALITEGPFKDLTVLSQRTLKNAKGVEKTPVTVGQEVRVYHSQIESTTNPGTMQNFFEVSTGLGASQDEINARLAMALSANVEKAMVEQTI